MKLTPGANPVTLHEGNTPLIPAPDLAKWIGHGIDLHLKYEGMNPTGSFKDRGMTTAITESLARGSKAVICASTGNTSASAAAYAARAGMTCFVLVPAGKVALGKIAGTLAYGARVLSIDGSFDTALNLVRKISEDGDVDLVNSVNPARIEGQQTAAWEIVEQLGQVPDWLSLPVGNAGNITAYWKGFCSKPCLSPCSAACLQCPIGTIKPRLLGTQAAGAAPLVLGHPVDHPETKATAIRIGNPARWDEAIAALSESGGHILAALDEEIFAAYSAVARTEGVFCEPSSAASVAGLKKALDRGEIEAAGQTVVCVLTGNGLKDPDSATESSKGLIPTEATFDALRRSILENL
ncbi:MAG: threonine synthase [Fimbriimonadaceae bacterium]|nr:threonine synthase [Fimbriimonadaceae bacterium]